MPRQRHQGFEYDLPVPPELQRHLEKTKHPLAELAALSESECRQQLAKQWKGLKHPANRAVAEAILALPLVCLSESKDHEYWLTFFSKTQRFSIVTPKHKSFPPKLKFPLADIPALAEFLLHFGGLTDWAVLPGAYFMAPAKLRTVRHGDRRHAWGDVKEWNGSLVLHGPGDVIILRADGAIGKWRHEYVCSAPIPQGPSSRTLKRQKHFDVLRSIFPEMEFPNPALRKPKRQDPSEEGPILKLDGDFPALLRSYLEYAALPEGAKKRKSPFYS